MLSSEKWRQRHQAMAAGNGVIMATMAGISIVISAGGRKTRQNRRGVANNQNVKKSERLVSNGGKAGSIIGGSARIMAPAKERDGVKTAVSENNKTAWRNRQ